MANNNLWPTIIGIFCLLYLTRVDSFVSHSANVGGKNCERIQVPLCSDTPYNFTRMPNIMGHVDQQNAAISIEEYKALVDAQCSSNLKFFLCSMFTPMCSDAVDVAITSCRSVCEEVKKNCLPLLTNFGLPWPESLNCSQLPVKGQGSLCMDPYPSNEVSHSDGRIRDLVNSKQPDTGSVPPSACGSDFEATDSNEDNCALKCDRDWMFSRENKHFAEIWMSSWAIICYLVTLFTVVTFCLDRSRFRYPERPIIFLSFCYNLYAFGYLLRYFLKADKVKCQLVKDGRSVLISGSLDNSSCVIVFMILYYFANACAIWWVILSFTWFLAAARKWGQEAISNISQFFHLVAWGLPALMTIAVMITHSVEASELTGLCYVGQQNTTSLLGYIIGPLSVFLVFGVGFTAAGLCAMVSIRKEMRQQDRDQDLVKVEKLMVRIGIFSLLYSLPTLVVIACCIYEYQYLELWTPNVVCKHTRTSADPICRDWSQPRPRVEIYMLKIFMSLVVGITCGMWVLSRKTFSTWRKFLTCGLLRGPGSKFIAYQPTALILQPPQAPVTVPLMNVNLHSSGSSATRYGFQTTRTASEASAKL